MIVNKHNTVDVYNKIVSWWVGHSFPPLSIDFLPEECFIIRDQGKDLYAIFVYHTDSKLAWLAFPVSNPDTTKYERANGLELLVKGTEEYLKQCGYRFIFTTSPLKTVQDSLTNNGFILGDENVNHYLKII